MFTFLAIRSGDYYMFDYESDEEEDEGNQDEATVAQEQVNNTNQDKSISMFYFRSFKF